MILAVLASLVLWPLGALARLVRIPVPTVACDAEPKAWSGSRGSFYWRGPFAGLHAFPVFRGSVYMLHLGWTYPPPGGVRVFLASFRRL